MYTENKNLYYLRLKDYNMSCLSRVIGCLSSALEQLGLYEPEINAQEALHRLKLEHKLWITSQIDRDELWNKFQKDNTTTGQLPTLVEKAVTHLINNHVDNGVAVDLGCGINTTTFNLLERGWKVYAVDSSKAVIQTLRQKVFSMGKSWIEDGQLVLVNKSIDNFEYPEKVHLITATDSLPYCDPRTIFYVFLKAKNALHPNGVLTCNLFPYNDNRLADIKLREVFGAWMTTKNVVEAVIRSVDFSSYSVTEGKSPGGFAKQFHILAYK